MLSGLARPASAGIVVSPLKQEVTVKPGRAETFYVSLSNVARTAADAPQQVRVEVMDYIVTEDGTLIFRAPGTVEQSASKWITVARPEVTVVPGRGQKIAFEVAAPFNAAGEYYAALMFTLAGAREPRGGIGVHYRIASGVFVTVPGRTLNRSAHVVRGGVVWGPPATQPAAAGDDWAGDLTAGARFLARRWRIRLNTAPQSAPSATNIP